MAKRNKRNTDFESLELYRQAVALTGYSALALRAQALFAFEHRGSKASMKVLSAAYGRNARRMSRSVIRWPNWFMPVDGKEPPDSEPDEILSLFAIASLPGPASQELYEKWTRYKWRHYQVEEKIEQLRQRVEKRPVIRLRNARLTVARPFVAHIRWEGEGDALDGIHDKPVRLVITDKSRVSDESDGEEIGE